MLFDIFMALLVMFFCCYLFSVIKYRDEDTIIGGGLLTLMLSVFPLIFVGSSWSNQASDLGTIYAQDEVIKVYKERIIRLEGMLNTFNYPTKPNISLDADTPWASIISSLSVAETQLVEAEQAKAEAIVSIEKRRHGPFSGVISFVGDYK